MKNLFIYSVVQIDNQISFQSLLSQVLFAHVE